MSLAGGSLLTAVEAVGDFAFKSQASGGSRLWGVVGFGAYIGLAGTLQYLLTQDNLSTLNAMWDATSNLLTYAIGVGWFGETLTPRQHAGVLLTVVGVWLLDGGK